MAVDPKTEQPSQLGDDGLAKQATAWAMVEAAPDALVMVDETGSIELVNSQAESLFGYQRAELLGKPVETLIPEELRRVHMTHRDQFRAGPTTRSMGSGLRLSARCADGSHVPVEVSLSPVFIDGRMCTIAAVRDITDRAEAEAKVERQRARSQANLEALADVRSTLLAKHSTDEVLELICRHARTLVNADTATFSRLSENKESLVHLAHNCEQSRTSFQDSVLTDKAIEDKAIEVAHDGNPWRSTASNGSGQDPNSPNIAVSPAMLVPVLGNDGIAAVLTLIRSSEAEHFGDDDLLLISGFASSASTALQLDQARISQQRTELFEDRERIGRDMHDLVIGRLFATGMGLQATTPRISDPDAKQRVQSAIDEIDESIKEIRTSIYGLHSRRDWGQGARGELLSAAADMKPVLGFEPHVRMSGAIDRMDQAQLSECLAALREALTNVARHSDATKVEIGVVASESHFILTVADDGLGFGTADPLDHEKNAAHLTGNGLANMKARAKALGGQLSIRSALGAGTTLEWSVPL